MAGALLGHGRGDPAEGLGRGIVGGAVTFGGAGLSGGAPGSAMPKPTPDLPATPSEPSWDWGRYAGSQHLIGPPEGRQEPQRDPRQRHQEEDSRYAAPTGWKRGR